MHFISGIHLMFPLGMMAFRFTEINTEQMNEWRVKWEDEVSDTSAVLLACDFLLWPSWLVNLPLCVRVWLMGHLLQP